MALAQTADTLNDQEREIVVEAAVLFAAVTGEIQGEERELIVTIAQSLGLSADHANAVIQSMLTDE